MGLFSGECTFDLVCHWSARIFDPRCPVTWRHLDVATYRAPKLGGVLTLGSFQSPRAARRRAISAISNIQEIVLAFRLTAFLRLGYLRKNSYGLKAVAPLRRERRAPGTLPWQSVGAFAKRPFVLAFLIRLFEPYS